MFDGLKDFLDLIRNDKTRIIIRLIAGILIASQVVKLANINVGSFIPSWALDALNLLVIPAIWFWSLLISIVIIGVFIGYFYRLSQKKNIYTLGFVRPLEYLAATILTVVVMFSGDTLPRVFTILGLVAFILFDLLMEYRKSAKSSSAS